MRDVCPLGLKFFHFHAALGKIWQNHMLAPCWRVVKLKLDGIRVHREGVGISGTRSLLGGRG